MKLQPQHLKPFWTQKNILFVSFALLLAVGIGITTAWLSGYDAGGAFRFEDAMVQCQTVNSYDNIAVQNTDEVFAHIRVKAIVHYREKLSDGTYGSLYPQPAVEGSDYTFTINTTDWVKGDDGYYYYRSPLAPGATTPQLVNGINLDFNGVPEGYEMRIEYLAEAIQSDPSGRPAQQAWGATIDGNNRITGASGFSN